MDRTTILALGLMMLSAGCQSTQPCDLCSSSAVAYGRVSSSTAAPLVGLRVRAQASLDTVTCSEASVFAEGGAAAVAGGATFVVRLVSLSTPARGCVRVSVFPVGAAADTVRVVGGVVQFRRDDRPEPRDSLRVDISIP